ncbi:MAG TPA: sigma-70 family RNA polymerase sigma factor [Steroidobacteraceae bacterium]|jgi:RNA polymerase sigma-70 factor (ECF subfamily)|nr:sigma-70 family RNA polymerase sigma factor [Steroidobacteraceae bacterium]
MNGVSVDEIEQVVASALNGDRHAESRMLIALRPGVLAVLRFGAFHRWIDAEDLTQETLHIVVERVRARTIDDPRKVFAFAAATARNLALNQARKMLRQQTVVDSELVDELAQNLEMEQTDLSDSDDRHLAQAVMTMLEELPTQRDRMVLVRFYLDGIDKQQLCREFGLSPKHFDRVLMRARTRLRSIIERRAPHLALFPRITAILLPIALSFTFWVRHFASW